MHAACARMQMAGEANATAASMLLMSLIRPLLPLIQQHPPVLSTILNIFRRYANYDLLLSF